MRWVTLAAVIAVAAGIAVAFRESMNSFPFNVSIIAAYGIAAGATRMLFRRLPVLVGVLIVTGYVAEMIWLSIPVIQCPGCDAGDGDRLYYFKSNVVALTAVALLAAASVAVGAVVAAWADHVVRR